MLPKSFTKGARALAATRHRAALLAHGLEWFGSVWHVKHTNDKKKDLVALLDRFFNGELSADLTPEQREIRAHWLPDGFVVVQESSSP